MIDMCSGVSMLESQSDWNTCCLLSTLKFYFVGLTIPWSASKEWGLETDKNPPMQRRKKAQFQFQGKTASAFHLLDRLALLSVRGIKRKRKDGCMNKRYRLESEACHLFPSLFVLEEILNQVQAKKKIMNPALASGACMHSGSRLLIWIDGTHSKDVFLQNTPDWKILTMVKKHG